MLRPESSANEGDGDDPPAERSSSRRPSVTEIVRTINDAPDGAGSKRDRSESGDAAPAGKLRARERFGEPSRSPAAAHVSRSVKDYLEDAMEQLENRVSASLSRDLHEFRSTVLIQMEAFENRLKDLEKHVEERDCVIEDLRSELQDSWGEVHALRAKAEDAELRSRLPCLILSGGVLAPRFAPRLPAPGSAPAPASEVTSRPPPTPSSPPDAARAGEACAGTARGGADPQAGPGASAGPQPAEGDRRDPSAGTQLAAGGDGRGRGARGRGPGETEDREDICGLVVNTVNRMLPGVNMTARDIDRAHRIPGPNNRIIVRFVQSGQGSVREEIMWRRLELRGIDLFCNESLTTMRSQIYQSLLAAKRQKKLYTVYTRGGHVFYKSEKYHQGVRVDSIQKLQQLGFTVVQPQRERR